MQEQDNKQNVDKYSYFICQACLSPHQDVQLCKCCLAINCKQCRQSHLCQFLEGSYHKTSSFLADKPKQFDIAKQTRQTSPAKTQANVQDQQNMRMKLQASILCNRCSVKQASEECKTCKIKYYCNSCFTSIHSATKFSKHQHAPIQQQRQIPTFQQGQFVKLSLKQLKASHQCNNMLDLRQKPCERLLAIQKKMNMIRRRLQFNKNAKICQLNEANHNIQTLFQSIIKRFKQKKQQMMLFLAQHYKSFMKSYQNQDKVLSREEVILQNLKLMKEYQRQPIQADRKCSLSQQSCTNMIRKISCETSGHIGIHYQDISKQFMLFQQKIQKISLKRPSFQLNRPKDIKLASSSTQQTSRCNIKSRRQQKTNKKSVNHSQSKSLSKYHPQAFTHPSPKNMMRNSVRLSNFNSYAIIQSIINENCKENIGKEPKINETKQIPYSNTKTKNYDNPIKQSYNDKILSPSIKHSKRNCQNNPYQILGNYGKYVEKAKKRSKEMKADIIQLAKFAYFSSVTNNENKR